MKKGVVELIEQMEVFYLANQEENLHFALIGDYKDGPEEHTKQDQGIIDTGKRLIEELNNRYARKDIFFSFIDIDNGMPDKLPGWDGKERGVH